MVFTGGCLLGSTGPKYVPRGVHVSMVLMTTHGTPEHGLTHSVTRINVATLCTRLTRMARIDFHNHPTGALSLVQEH